MIIKMIKYAVLLIVAVGCAQIQTLLQTQGPDEGVRPEMLNGEKCMASPNLIILQVLDHGILAQLCPVDYPDYYNNAFDACAIKGDTVHMAIPPEQNDYVDNQKITLNNTQCFVSDGTYKYIRNDGIRSTVRNIKIVTEDPSVRSKNKSSTSK